MRVASSGMPTARYALRLSTLTTYELSSSTMPASFFPIITGRPSVVKVSLLILPFKDETSLYFWSVLG